MNEVMIGSKMVFSNEFNRHEWGMTPKEFKIMDLHYGQTAEVIGIDIEDSGKPDYVTIRFSDGYTLEAVSVANLK